MPPQAIHQLAEEIVNQTILNNWLFYIVLACITIVLSAAGSFLSSYFSKRAEQRALSADFEEIKRRLQESTSLTESVKVEINRLSARSEKLEWLKREKLETYFTSVLRGVEFLSLSMYHQFFDAPDPGSDDPMAMASMLQKLYLPELDEQHAELMKVVSRFRVWVGEGMKQRARSLESTGVKVPPTREHMDQYSRLLQLLNANVLTVEYAARDLSRNLNKV